MPETEVIATYGLKQHFSISVTGQELTLYKPANSRQHHICVHVVCVMCECMYKSDLEILLFYN
jgi:hypothetical protein